MVISLYLDLIFFSQQKSPVLKNETVKELIIYHFF